MIQGLAPQGKKVKHFGNVHLVDRLHVCSLRGNRHVGIYASRDNWCTCLHVLLLARANLYVLG